jgi:ribosome maturation factor RimP
VSNRETIVNILHDCGVELYDLETASEFEQRIYRIYITSSQGINLDKCAEVTRILAPILDLDPPISGPYTLEVSSPGIERPLKRIEQFQGSIGENIKVKLINTDKIIGKLESIEDGKITIKEEDGEVSVIPLDEIEKARTYYQW